MHKLFIWLLAGTLALNFSCNSVDDTDKKKLSKKEKVTGDEPSDEPEVNEDDEDQNIRKLAAGICNCMGNAADEVGEDAKRILLKASKSSNPAKTIQNEVAKIEDEEEKQKLGQEFTNLGKLAQDEGIQKCVDKLEKKYNVSDKDMKAQKRIALALEKDANCSVVSALMNIGVKTQQAKDEE